MHLFPKAVFISQTRCWRLALCTSPFLCVLVSQGRCWDLIFFEPVFKRFLKVCLSLLCVSAHVSQLVSVHVFPYLPPNSFLFLFECWFLALDFAFVSLSLFFPSQASPMPSNVYMPVSMSSPLLRFGRTAMAHSLHRSCMDPTDHPRCVSGISLAASNMGKPNLNCRQVRSTLDTRSKLYTCMGGDEFQSWNQKHHKTIL